MPFAIASQLNISIMSKTKDYYFSMFKIDDTEALNKAKAKEIATGIKMSVEAEKCEVLGDKALKMFNVFQRLFPEYLGCQKVEDVPIQRFGVDYYIQLTNGVVVKVDVKCCIGPDYNTIPIEYRQYGKEVFKDSKVDYLLYLTFDNFRRRAILVPIETVLRFLEKAPSCLEKHLSKNGTGEYFKMDYEKVKSVKWIDLDSQY